MKRLTLSLISATVLAFSSISCLEPAICSDEYVYGLEISLVDEATGEPAGSGALVTVSHGDYEENHVAEEYGPVGVKVYAAGERAGIYDIAITAEGYRQWAVENVFVRENRCHVITVEITARLESEDP